MSFWSLERRKTMPPAVGSRTISWMTGRFLKTVSLSLLKGEGLYCFGRASGTLRLLPLLAGGLFRGEGGFFGVDMMIFFRGVEAELFESGAEDTVDEL